MCNATYRAYERNTGPGLELFGATAKSFSEAISLILTDVLGRKFRVVRAARKPLDGAFLPMAVVMISDETKLFIVDSVV